MLDPVCLLPVLLFEPLYFFILVALHCCVAGLMSHLLDIVDEGLSELVELIQDLLLELLKITSLELGH